MDLSYVYSPMDEAILYKTLPERLQHFAREMPNKPAFVFYTVDGQRTSMTCLELYEKSLQFAKGLKKMGIMKGDIVAIGLPNIAEWLVSHFGIVMAGGIALGFKFERKDGADILHFINKSENCQAVIFYTDSCDQNDEIIKQIVDGTDNKGQVKKSEASSLRFAVRHGHKHLEDFPFTFDDVLALGMNHAELDLPALDPDDTCMILLTSGTTGFSKLVPWSHFRILGVPKSAQNVMNIALNDVYFNPQPFHSVGGYVLNYLNVGCAWVTVDNILRTDSVEEMAKLIAKIINAEKCNQALIVGLVLHYLGSGNVELGPGFPIENIYVGGYPLRHSVAETVGLVTKKIVVIYGSTEFGINTIKEITDAIAFTDYHCGLPCRGIEVKVVDDNNAVCVRGKSGIIHLRGRISFRGYLNEIEKTKEVITNGQWYNTQDIGYVTEAGEIVVMGRTSELVHVGNINISPSLVESMITKHPDVKLAAIIPVPDKITFQQLCACIVRKEQSGVSWDAIEYFLREHFSAKKGMNELIPKYHVFLESFPTTVNGKIKAKELTEEALSKLHSME